MTAKEKAEELVNKHRMILMNSDTDLGEEIQCSIISKQFALIAVNEILNSVLEKDSFYDSETWEYYNEVKQRIEKL